jgi:hypothetical protein
MSDFPFVNDLRLYLSIDMPMVNKGVKMAELAGFKEAD